MTQRRQMGSNVIPGGVTNPRFDLAPRDPAIESLAQRIVEGRFAGDADGAREVLAILGLDRKVVE